MKELQIVLQNPKSGQYSVLKEFIPYEKALEKIAKSNTDLYRQVDITRQFTDSRLIKGTGLYRSCMHILAWWTSSWGIRGVELKENQDVEMRYIWLESFEDRLYSWTIDRTVLGKRHKLKNNLVY